MYSLPSDCCIMAMVDDKAHKDIHMKGLQPRYGRANEVRKKGKRGAFAWDMADPDARQSLPSRRQAQTMTTHPTAVSCSAGSWTRGSSFQTRSFLRCLWQRSSEPRVRGSIYYLMDFQGGACYFFECCTRVVVYAVSTAPAVLARLC